MSAVFAGMAISIFYKNYKNILVGEVEMLDDYNAVSVFRDTMDSIIKFSIRKVVRSYRFTLHYLVLIILKGLDILQLIVENRYQALRAFFVSKSVENKAFVVHFWGHLKHYKREMDKEEEDVEKK
jgi:hypothetical protein